VFALTLIVTNFRQTSSLLNEAHLNTELSTCLSHQRSTYLNLAVN